MNIKNKNIIVFGLGVTGKSSIKALSKMGANIFIYDDRDYDQYKETLLELSDYNFNIINSSKEIIWSEIYCVLKSPGIKLNNNFILEANENNTKVYSDIELAYKLWGGDNFIAITGTNGKTTTTSLVSHILNYCGIKSKVVGNIGVGLLYEILENGLDYVYALELSSFQLSSIEEFRAKVSVITNISEDHTDWHGSFDNYVEAKKNIYKNIKKTDKIILNKDDNLLNDIKLNANIEYFSLKQEADAYFDGKELIIGKKSFSKNLLQLVGKHNIANTLAALLAIKDYNIEYDKIVEAVSKFKSIEHRIEFVKDINSIKFYNDSKGTNIDSTKVALEGFDDNVILIAGGYDKKVDFDDLFINNTNIKKLILFGQTKDKIKFSAEKFGLQNIIVVEDLEEAVNLSFEIGEAGDKVLFSPACASWDMYDNYEQRGNHFKKLVLGI